MSYVALVDVEEPGPLLTAPNWTLLPDPEQALKNLSGAPFSGGLPWKVLGRLPSPASGRDCPDPGQSPSPPRRCCCLTLRHGRLCEEPARRWMAEQCRHSQCRCSTGRTAAGNRPPASRVHAGVTNVMTSNT
jgi:hypothetical protein